MKPCVESGGCEVMVIYRLQNASAKTWTMETNYDPKQYFVQTELFERTIIV
ncbi:MAG: hypothetical protein ACYSWZ_02970 [Planctomycetota bacterium]|jgi:hypothetical protein